MNIRIELVRKLDRADIILVAPEGKPPTLDEAVLSDLDNVLKQLESDPPRVVVLRSASERFFCVGANIKVLKEIDAETIVPWVEAGHHVINRLEDLPCVSIARVGGYAMGGGLELAMACDLIFALDSAVFGQSEARLGFIPGWGGCRRFVERVGLATAKYYFYSGRTIDAEKSLAIGLADFAGSAEEVDAELDALIRDVCANSAYALNTFKRIVNAEQLSARERNLQAEADCSRGCLEDSDTLNRLNNFLEKRK